MLTATLTSPEATGRFARLFAARLAAPALVTLRGELGTGKTTLVRDILHALGVEGVVASPSFTLAQSYEGADSLRLHHLDLYRLGPGADVSLFAWEDYLDGSSLTFVEWPEAGAAELPPADVDVALTHRTPDSRGLALRAAPGLEAALAADMAATGIDDVLLAPGVSASDEATAGGGATPRAGKADTPADREARSPRTAT
jgi:tRNA threonylcarbamoyladenosine biosynthesis protein TsaE